MTQNSRKGNLMDHKFEGARGKHRNQDMRPEFSASHTGSMTSDRVCGLLLKCVGEKPEVKLTYWTGAE